MAADYLTQASSDNFRFARSKVIISPADGTYPVIRMPKFAFLIDLFFQLVTPYTAASSGTITLGLIGGGETADPDAFLEDVYIGSETAGWSRMSGGSAAQAEGFWFNEASGLVSLTVAVGDSAATIKCQAIAMYTVIH